jgi:hypothetical protein
MEHIIFDEIMDTIDSQFDELSNDEKKEVINMLIDKLEGMKSDLD